jgi:hypothetical protein
VAPPRAAVHTGTALTGTAGLTVWGACRYAGELFSDLPPAELESRAHLDRVDALLQVTSPLPAAHAQRLATMRRPCWLCGGLSGRWRTASVRGGGIGRAAPTRAVAVQVVRGLLRRRPRRSRLDQRRPHGRTARRRPGTHGLRPLRERGRPQPHFVWLARLTVYTIVFKCTYATVIDTGSHAR